MSNPSTPVTMNHGPTGRKGRRLGYKRRMLIGTWNLRSGIENQENYEMARQTLHERQLDLLCIPEAAKSEQGNERGPNGEALYWVGPTSTERRQNAGVALMCSPYAARCIISHSYASDRILVVSFALLNNLTLDVDCLLCPPQLPSRVGPEDLSRSAKFGNQNAAGKAFLDDCAAAGMCIANTFFPHKDIHKYSYRGVNTTVIPGADPENVLYNNDFILVRRSFLSSVHDVKVYRGVNGISNFTRSDHHLVVAKLKLKLRAPRSQAPKRDHSLLASDPVVRTRYQELVRSKIAHMVSIPDEDISGTTYQQLSDVLLAVANDILPICESRLLQQPPPSPPPS
ncbi:hypothetical protein Ndes2526B_g08610 [Nannochloris sp. 'desiccata']